MAFEAFHLIHQTVGLNTQICKSEDMIEAAYQYFKSSGHVEKITKKEAVLYIKDESKGWLKEICDKGVVYTENLDLVFFGIDYGIDAHSLKYDMNASQLKNNAASQILGFEVFGDCILESQSAQPCRSVRQL